MLAVVAMVVMVVALLLISSQSRKVRAHRAQCLANVRQLAVAELIYAADHRGRFCPGYLDYDALALKNVWMGTLADYHGRPDGVWLCPSVTNPPSSSYRGSAEAPWTYTDPVSGKSTRGAYAINGYLGLGRNYKKAKDTTFKVQNVFYLESAVQQPARTPVFNDAVYWNCILEETASPSRNLYEPQGIIVATGRVKRVLTQFVARHGDFPASQAPREVTSNFLPGAINIAFADGHAGTVPLENLWTLYWHRGWDAIKVPRPHPPPK
jgi:prepilin-type processing-associated H-X9-DG protein